MMPPSTESKVSVTIRLAKHSGLMWKMMVLLLIGICSFLSTYLVDMTAWVDTQAPKLSLPIIEDDADGGTLFHLTKPPQQPETTTMIRTSNQQNDNNSTATRNNAAILPQGYNNESTPKPVVVVDPTFNPFQLWPRRNQVPQEDIRGVLQRIDSNSTCRNNAFHFPSLNNVSSLEQIAAAILRKSRAGNGRNRTKLVLGVLGNSVSADIGGWVAALQSFLTTSPLFKANRLSVETRNYAKGGTGPRFTYFCNELRGDEDIVIFQNSSPGEADALHALVNSLKKSGFGVLLVSWRGSLGYAYPRHKLGFEKAANDFNVPLLFLNEDESAVRACLPPTANLSKPVKELIYRDKIHPTRLGEITIASMVGRTIEKAASLFLQNDNSNEREPVFLPERTLNSFEAVCFSRLECSEKDLQLDASENSAHGTRRCLVPKETAGFQLGHSEENGKLSKTWWEGFTPGNSIEFVLNEKCSEIVLFYNWRVTNGMAKITVDDKILDKSQQQLFNDYGDLPPGILDGWFKGFDWMPRHRGHLKDQVIAHDLEPSPHSVRLEIQNTTHSEDGTFKFDFVAMACKKGQS